MTENSSDAGGDAGSSSVDAGGDAPWHASFEGDDLGWLENRGLTKLSAKEALPVVIDGFRNAEKKIGLPSDQILRLPADRTVEGSMNEVYNSLGRPEASDGYELKTDADGGDKDFSEWAKTTFHKAGLSQKQADGLYSEFTGMIASSEEKKIADTNLANQAADADLRREWGGTYDHNMDIAKQAVWALGATTGVVDKIEEIFGYSEVMKMFNTIGTKIGEDVFIGPDNTAGIPGLPSTPQAASQRIKELKNDSAFVTKYNSSDHEARTLMTNLHKIAAKGA